MCGGGARLDCDLSLREERTEAALDTRGGATSSDEARLEGVLSPLEVLSRSPLASLAGSLISFAAFVLSFARVESEERLVLSVFSVDFSVNDFEDFGSESAASLLLEWCGDLLLELLLRINVT